MARIVATLTVALSALGIAATSVASTPPKPKVWRSSYRFVFTGSLSSVATVPANGGSATNVWTTNVRWRFVYRVPLDSARLPSGLQVLPHVGGLCGYPNGPSNFVCRLAPGSSLVGSSVGVYNPGAADIDPGCLNFALQLVGGWSPKGFQLLKSPTGPTGPLLALFGAPGYTDSLHAVPSQCQAPIQGYADCNPAFGRATLRQYDGPAVPLTVLDSRARQSWSVSGTCRSTTYGFQQDAHWSGRSRRRG